VPFGKYKGLPIEVLLSDHAYSDWLAQQNWLLDRFPAIHTLVINNHGEPTETPEHNALQAKFFDRAWQLALLKAVAPGLFEITEREFSKFCYDEEMEQELARKYENKPSHGRARAAFLADEIKINAVAEVHGFDIKIDGCARTEMYNEGAANMYAAIRSACISS
jgi:hypothetical protein